MTAGRTNHTQFASGCKPVICTACPNHRFCNTFGTCGEKWKAEPRNQDPCPSCDGDEYDNASGECSECGHTDSEGGEIG